MSKNHHCTIEQHHQPVPGDTARVRTTVVVRHSILQDCSVFAHPSQLWCTQHHQSAAVRVSSMQHDEMDVDVAPSLAPSPDKVDSPGLATGDVLVLYSQSGQPLTITRVDDDDGSLWVLASSADHHQCACVQVVQQVCTIRRRMGPQWHPYPFTGHLLCLCVPGCRWPPALRQAARRPSHGLCLAIPRWR